MSGNGILAAALVLAGASLVGCVSPPREAPAWFVAEDEARDRGYPSLHNVPRGTIANTDARYWARHRAQLVEEGAQVRAHPRASASAEGENPEEFMAEAREQLEATRQSHTP